MRSLVRTASPLGSRYLIVISFISICLAEDGKIKTEIGITLREFS